MFHVVTPFPFLLDFAIFAPLLLRLALGFFILALGFSSRAKNAVIEETKVIKDINNQTETTVTTSVASSALSFGEIAYRFLFIVAGFSLIIGFYVQIGALIVALLIFVSIFDKKARLSEEIGMAELVLLLVIALSLITLGAGPYAIDLPL